MLAFWMSVAVRLRPVDFLPGTDAHPSSPHHPCLNDAPVQPGYHAERRMTRGESGNGARGTRQQIAQSECATLVIYPWMFSGGCL